MEYVVRIIRLRHGTEVDVAAEYGARHGGSQPSRIVESFR